MDELSSAPLVLVQFHRQISCSKGAECSIRNAEGKAGVSFVFSVSLNMGDVLLCEKISMFTVGNYIF